MSNGVCCVCVACRFWPFVFIFRMSVIRFEIVGTSTTAKWEPRTHRYIPVTGILENIQHGGATNPILYTSIGTSHDDFYGKCDLVFVTPLLKLRNSAKYEVCISIHMKRNK